MNNKRSNGAYDRTRSEINAITDPDRLIFVAVKLRELAVLSERRASGLIQGKGGLTASELRYCKLEGIKPKDFAARKAS